MPGKTRDYFVKLVLALAAGVTALSFISGGSSAHMGEQVHMVRMRDGVRLSTRVFLPDQVPRAGVPALLMRTPYRFPGSASEYYARTARFHTRRGYAFVLQDTRGRFASEGEFRPFEGEKEDGRDTVEWLTSQPWSNGRVGALGGSYNGFTALMVALDNPHISAIVVDDPAADFTYGMRDGGISLLPLFWLYLLDRGTWPNDEQKRIASNSSTLPDQDEKLLGHDSRFWNLYVSGTRASNRDNIWATRSVRNQYGQICAPALIVKSRSEPWEDPIEIWHGLRKNSCPQYRNDHRLIVTAEGHTHHLTALGTVSTEVNEEMVRWIDTWLGQKKTERTRDAPVSFRAPTDPGYRSADDWPAATTERELFLGNPGHVKTNAVLSPSAPFATGADSIRIDSRSMDPCGSYPNMSYVSDRLSQPLYMAGSARADLFLSISGSDADVSVLLYEYNEKDRKPLQYITFGTARASRLTRVVPGDRLPITIHMHSLAHEFRASSRIAIAVTGSLCGYAEHSEPAPITYRVLYGGASPSRITIPFIASK